MTCPSFLYSSIFFSISSCTFLQMLCYRSQPSVDRIIQASRSGRIRRTQMENLSFCSSNELPNLDPVPYIALPIESSLSSNLFKSRSMESIDARTSDDSVCATERECLSSTIANLAEVDSVSSGLNRLNVNE